MSRAYPLVMPGFPQPFDLTGNKNYRLTANGFVEFTSLSEVADGDLVYPGDKADLRRLDAIESNVSKLYALQKTAATTATQALSALRLTNARTIGLSGDATGSASFDGSANSTIALTLANSGVVAGTYGGALTVPAVTVDAKGRLTSVVATPIAAATLTGAGVVQLSNAVTSTSDTLAASASAVKQAYDLAASKGTVSSVALSGTEFTFTGSPILTSGTIGLSLAATGVVSGTYTNPTISVDSKGRITSVSAGAAGEANTGQNLGTGTGVFASKSGVALQFKTLVGGAGVSLSSTATEITIASTTAGTVTSVGLTGSEFVITSSPVTTSGNIGIALANSGVTAGAYGSSVAVPTLNVDSKGRLTSVVATPIRTASTAQTGIVQLTDATNSTSTTTAATANAVNAAWTLANSKGTGSVTSVAVSAPVGEISVSGSPILNAGTITLGLANTGVVPGTYSLASVTVDARGRVMSIANGSVPTGSGTTTSNPLAISDEGVSLTSNAASINFVGSGVTATTSGNAVTVTVPSFDPTSLRSEFNAGLTSVKGGAGLAIDGTYVPNENASYIANAFTLASADDLLDAAVKDLAATVAGLSGGTGSAGGTVTSVAITSTDLSVSGSPITNSGTISVNLPNTGATAGSYSNPTLTIDAKGRVLTIANGTGGTGSALTVQDEGTNLSTAVTSLNFVGAGVTASNSGGAVTVTVPSSTFDATAIQTEIDAIESGAGLGTNGAYAANATANYLSAATSLKDADNRLDTAIKAATDLAATKASQTEIDATQEGAGLGTTGAYTANATAAYVSGATSLKDADDKLDGALKALATVVATKGTGNGNGTVTSVALTGTADIAVSGSPITNSGTLTVALSNTTATPGSYTNANITVDSKGRITAVSNGSAGAGGSSSLVIKEEGSNLTSTPASINFVGAGVTAASDASGNVTVTVPGSSAGSSPFSWYSFKVNFDGATTPAVSSVTEGPAGWNFSISGTTITITHGLGTDIIPINTTVYGKGLAVYGAANYNQKSPNGISTSNLSFTTGGTTFIMYGLTASNVSTVANGHCIVRILIAN